MTFKINLKIKNKHAVLFTLISVLMAALFIAMFSYDNTVSLDETIPSTNLRVKVIDSYVKNFEIYAEESLSISTYRTLEAMTNYQAETEGDFLVNELTFNETFSNCMNCGYRDCSTPTPLTKCGAPLTSGSDSYDLNATLNRIILLADKQLNINTTYIINSIEIEQKYPFEVEVSLDIFYKISDKTNSYASWDKRQKINKTISIIGLTDPLPTIKTNGVYITAIKQTNLCAHDEGCWNIANFTAFYNAKEFKYFKNSTSYLSRFWNSEENSDCCGIESMVDAGEVDDLDISYTDHQYWEGTEDICDNLLVFDSINPNFKLDIKTAIRYNIKDSGNSLCP